MTAAWGWDDEFPRYVSTAERRVRAEAMRKRLGGPYDAPPVGRQIATTFWGQAWCTNLERYSDFANRLPRGRSYLRSGCVVQLSIERGSIESKVMGSSLYSVRVTVSALPLPRWDDLKRACTGKIESLVALLEGRLSDDVMVIVTRETSGLFPSPSEIRLSCSCPDSARLCKHVAATLYAVAVRLDAAPELLFVLRGVEHGELASGAPALWAPTTEPGTPLDDDLSALFGIDLDMGTVSGAATPKTPKRRKPLKPLASRKVSKARVTRQPAKKAKAPIRLRAGDTITTQELRSFGLVASTIQSWRAEGLLVSTDRRGVYVVTRDTARRLAAYTARR
ncbi:MAG: SWIM zinc finger family protein [Thermoanaerobaculia bacterium]